MVMITVLVLLLIGIAIRRRMVQVVTAGGGGMGNTDATAMCIIMMQHQQHQQEDREGVERKAQRIEETGRPLPSDGSIRTLIDIMRSNRLTRVRIVPPVILIIFMIPVMIMSVVPPVDLSQTRARFMKWHAVLVII